MCVCVCVLQIQLCQMVCANTSLHSREISQYATVCVTDFSAYENPPIPANRSSMHNFLLVIICITICPQIYHKSAAARSFSSATLDLKLRETASGRGCESLRSHRPATPCTLAPFPIQHEYYEVPLQPSWPPTSSRMPSAQRNAALSPPGL